MAGGDSIVAITVINRARALGLAIAPRDVFLCKTPRALAEELRSRAPRTVAPERARPQEGPFAPTPIILRRRELGGTLGGFAQARTLVTDEGTTFAGIERAANAVVAAHPALRMRLDTAHGVWTPHIGPSRQVTVVHADFGDTTLAANAAAARLDPGTGEVVAFTWLAATRTLVVTAHHLAVDTVSWLILLDDLATALRGEALPPATTSYAEYADALTARAAHTTEGLGDWITVLDAPAALPGTGSRARRPWSSAPR